MKKEYDKAPGFKSWYKPQQEEMRKDKLLTFFFNMRDVSIHQKSVNPRFWSSFSVAIVFAMPSGSTIVPDDKRGTYLTNVSVAEVAPTDVTKIRPVQTWPSEKPE